MTPPAPQADDLRRAEDQRKADERRAAEVQTPPTRPRSTIIPAPQAKEAERQAELARKAAAAIPPRVRLHALRVLSAPS